jgi:hypothetical protein
MRFLGTLALLLWVVSFHPSSAQATERIPATVDPTGRTDVTAKLERFVNSLPNGTTVVLAPHADYRVDGTLEWRRREGITIDGNGATLTADTHGGPHRATVRLLDCTGWTIRDLNIRGPNSGGRFVASYQWQHGIDLRGVDRVTLSHVKVAGVFGDAIYVGMSTTSPEWSQDVSIIDSMGAHTGRMSVSITAGRRVTVRGGSWSTPAFTTFDIEPNNSAGGAQDVVVEGTTIGPEARFGDALIHFGRGLVSTGSALAMIGRGSISGITLRDNRLIGRPLHVVAEQFGGLRPQHIAVEDNVSTATYEGPPPAAMYFRNVDGLTVGGNQQPIAPGSGLAMVATRDSAGVRVIGQYPYQRLTGPGSRLPYLIAGLAVLLAIIALAHRLVTRRQFRS